MRTVRLPWAQPRRRELDAPDLHHLRQGQLAFLDAFGAQLLVAGMLVEWGVDASLAGAEIVRHRHFLLGHETRSVGWK
jgi:hypothetical protein